MVMPSGVEDAFPGFVEAEFALVGALINSPDVWPEVEFLRGENFREPFIGHVWESLRDAWRQGAPLPVTALMSRYADEPALKGFGGPIFFADLAERAPPSTQAAAIAHEVFARSVRARLSAVGRPGLSLDAAVQEAREILDTALLRGSAKAINPTTFVWAPSETIPPRRWVYGRHLVRGFVSCTVSPGGIGKSALEISEMVAMGSGRALLGDWPEAPLRVWYWNGEDPIDEIRRRLTAAMMQFKIGPEDIGDRLMIDSGREMPICLATESANGFSLNHEAFRQLERRIVELKIDVVILDPLVKAHAVNENDNNKINAIVAELGAVAGRTNCAFELVHHVRKPGAGAAGDTTVDDARGAGALVSAVRSARVLNLMTENEAETAEVENRYLFFRVDNGKANLTPRSENAVWRRLVGVDLKNGGREEGDQIGVATTWTMPGIFKGLSGATLRRVQHAISQGAYRLDYRSPQWVGKVVAGITNKNLDDKADRAAVREMVNIWIKNKALRIVEDYDENRTARPFVQVGKWVEEDER